MSSVDVAKQLDERDAAHKAEIEQLKGRIAELLDEKEQREGQLKKTQDSLVASETDASTAHAELASLKEQAKNGKSQSHNSMLTDTSQTYL
jgi:chromosome segregation ATPase